MCAESCFYIHRALSLIYTRDNIVHIALLYGGGEGMPGNQAPVEIFCSYAHEDEAWQQKLKKHLSVLQRQGRIVQISLTHFTIMEVSWLAQM